MENNIVISYWLRDVQKMKDEIDMSRTTLERMSVNKIMKNGILMSLDTVFNTLNGKGEARHVKTGKVN